MGEVSSRNSRNHAIVSFIQIHWEKMWVIEKSVYLLCKELFKYAEEEVQGFVVASFCQGGSRPPPLPSSATIL